MSDFAVKVVRIDAPVEHHPDADRLSLIRIGGYTCISAKLDDGSHRYNTGDLVVYVPEGAVVPEYLLRQGFWNDEKGQGILAGSKGDRVKAMRLRGIFSQGILFPVLGQEPAKFPHILDADGDVIPVKDGDDIAKELGIIKYEPPIPVALAGEMAAVYGAPAKYDFESIQKVTDLFTVGEAVVATEKLHGTNCQIGYVPGLGHDEMFFDGNLYVTSKGMGGQGLAFKNNEKNDSNTYVKALSGLISGGFADKVKELATETGEPVRVWGEVYGAGVQKGFGYGHKTPAFAVFDIKIGGRFLPYEEMLDVARRLGLTVVPTLYEGPYDLAALEPFRDGKDSLSGTNLREGIVIKARDGGYHVNHGRKIGKWVSPAYLLKSTGEEFN